MANRGSTACIPIWVRVPAIIALILVAVIISTMLLGAENAGGGHGSGDQAEMTDHTGGEHGSGDQTGVSDHTDGKHSSGDQTEMTDHG